MILRLRAGCGRRAAHSSGAVKPKEHDLPPEAEFIGKPFSKDVVYTKLQQIVPDGQKPKPLLEHAD